MSSTRVETFFQQSANMADARQCRALRGSPLSVVQTRNPIHPNQTHDHSVNPMESIAGLLFLAIAGGSHKHRSTLLDSHLHNQAIVYLVSLPFLFDVHEAALGITHTTL